MRALTYLIATTVDGFIAREDGTSDCFPQSGEHLRYLAEEYPETIPDHAKAVFGASCDVRHFDTVLMGRRTYEVGLPFGITNPYSSLRQYVLSSTLQGTLHPAVQVVSSDPVGLVRRLKQEAGLGIWLCGGGILANVLQHEIDELILKINPVILGTGTPLFTALPSARRLELKVHRTFPSGVAIHHYKLIG